ncbi:MAG TPA: type II secretion system F family protein [Solirubrobacteraceae bacterium]|nr:type II secretion system F family protein [Solirubrobacteraceae bacterium]
MIVLMMIAGVGLLALSGWSLVRAGISPRLDMQSHLAQIEDYGIEQATDELEGGGGSRTRPLARLAAHVGRYAERSLPALPRLARNELNAAGIYQTETEVIAGYRLMAGGTAAALVLLYSVALSGGLSVLGTLLAAAAAFAGWDLPGLVIRRRGTARLSAIEKQLPDLIDLLVASVEAGLSVGASIALLADRFAGPLGEELQLILHQQRLGTSMGAAMTAFGERADTPGVRAFTRTLTRAEAMGGSIGPVLRSLAADARRRRRQLGRERAAKVPVKILIPLILLIFPSLFVVLLYPAGYSIMHAFGH